MKFFAALLLTAVAGTAVLSAADLSKVTDAKRWTIVESTGKTEGNALVVNMPIDHKKGPANYLIGWPRLYLLKLNAGETDWSKAKAISFDLKLEFTGKTASWPITFHTFWRSKGAKKNESMTTRIAPALKNNTVNKVVVPLDKVKDPANVSGFGFSISESHYKHGENLKFTVSNFKLVGK